VEAGHVHVEAVAVEALDEFGHLAFRASRMEAGEEHRNRNLGR
jgi:hypothetical protein